MNGFTNAHRFNVLQGVRQSTTRTSRVRFGFFTTLFRRRAVHLFRLLEEREMARRRKVASTSSGTFLTLRVELTSVAVITAALLLNGCGNSPSSLSAFGDPRNRLVGCYSTRPGGDAEIRVRKQEKEYLLSIAADWTDESVAAEPTPDEIKELFDDQAPQYVSGVYSGMLGLFEVRPGMRINDDTVKGKHVVVIPFGAGEAYPADCPTTSK